MQFVPFSSRLKAHLAAPSVAAQPSDSDSTPMPDATAAPAATASANAPSVPKPASPIVNLKRDGDKITRIEIQCTCGETIALDCDY